MVKLKFKGAPHLQVYRADHILRGKAIAVGEVVDLPDADAGYLISDFPSMWSVEAGNIDVAKAAHGKAKAEAEEAEAEEGVIRRVLKRSPKTA